jgi:four helix bundle protein
MDFEVTAADNRTCQTVGLHRLPTTTSASIRSPSTLNAEAKEAGGDRGSIFCIRSFNKRKGAKQKMSLTNFRTYQLALEFAKECVTVQCPYYLKDQFQRASSSVVLNLAEGSGKPTERDRAKFYAIAMGSFRECQAILALLDNQQSRDLLAKYDRLGASLYELHRVIVGKAKLSNDATVLAEAGPEAAAEAAAVARGPRPAPEAVPAPERNRRFQ